MVRILINGKPVHAQEGATILEAARDDKYARQQFDIYIPSINYRRGIQDADDSGICVVEVAGRDGLVNASTTVVEEAMEVQTNTPEVRNAQLAVLKDILDHHDLDCKACHRTGNCELQSLQWKFRTTKPAESAKRKRNPIDTGRIIVRDSDKCVSCGRCVAVCNNVQQIHALEMKGTGQDAEIVTLPGCIHCGQCITVCPVGALKEQDDTDAIFAAIEDESKTVIVQAAPSVRAGIGEYFNYPIGSETQGKLASALRALGFDYVFDTEFGADLTILEEATELISRIKNGGVLPMTTSCCPGWIKYCEMEYPEFLPHISSCKSPHQMSGAVIKTYFAEKMHLDKKDIVVVSVMPCTAKKFEITRPGQDAAGVPDVDYSITVRELGRMIEKKGISFVSLENGVFDSPIGTGSGAGAIFGAAGGVMEAALRTAADWLTGKELPDIEYNEVRGIAGVKEASYNLAGQEIKVAAVSGIANAKHLIEAIQNGKADYTFVEIMACPGGCVNGGGQPQQKSDKAAIADLRRQRAKSLYFLDTKSGIRRSHENPEIKEIYAEYIGEPGNETAHHLLHTVYSRREKQ